MKKIILASKSPRRQELLKYITEDFESIPSNEEEICPDDLPLEKCAEYLAKIKAQSILKDHSDSIVIGSDTVVLADNRLLGKPHSRQEAFDMLSLLSGRVHKVITGCCICSEDKIESFSQVTSVEFYPLSEKEINDYIDTREPFDKAGGYGIQGKGAFLVKEIVGDYYNVMGLPVALVNRKLKEF